MRAKRTLSLIAAAVTVTALAAVGATLVTGTDKKPPPKTGFIQGKVTSGDRHPEAGVWVIAETADLPTPYRKIVVTDDRGRFVVPELPEADYQVWVRGYGLLDSAKVPATVERKGRRASRSRPRSATTPQEAAANYPANYWLSLFKPPANTRRLRAAQPARLGERLQARLRALPPDGLDQRARHARNRAGPRRRPQEGGVMDDAAMGLGRDAVLDALADWGGRIAAGEVPEAPPARPQGIERNIVITQWGWGDCFTYAHDEIATDKRNPTLYPDGRSGASTSATIAC